MSFDVMRVRLHLRGVRVTGVVVDTPQSWWWRWFLSGSCRRVRFVAVRAGGFMTVAAERSVIWSTAAARRCCYGPSGGSFATTAESVIWKPSPVRRWSHSPVGAQAGPRRSGDAYCGGVPPPPCGVPSGDGPCQRLVRADPDAAS